MESQDSGRKRARHADEDSDLSLLRGPGQLAEATPESYAKYKASQERRGIIYMSRVPPYMKPAKVRDLLEVYGKITNVSTHLDLSLQAF